MVRERPRGHPRGGGGRGRPKHSGGAHLLIRVRVRVRAHLLVEDHLAQAEHEDLHVQRRHGLAHHAGHRLDDAYALAEEVLGARLGHQVDDRRACVQGHEAEHLVGTGRVALVARSRVAVTQVHLAQVLPLYPGEDRDRHRDAEALGGACGRPEG